MRKLLIAFGRGGGLDSQPVPPMRTPWLWQPRPQCARRTWFAEPRDRRHRPRSIGQHQWLRAERRLVHRRLHGGEGWVSSRYLSGDFDAGQIVVTEQPTAAVRWQHRPATPARRAGVVTGGAGGAVTGAVVGGPVGAAVGGVAGVIAGGTTGTVLDPPRRVRTYVSAHRMRPSISRTRSLSEAACPIRSSCARFPTMSTGTSM